MCRLQGRNKEKCIFFFNSKIHNKILVFIEHFACIFKEITLRKGNKTTFIIYSSIIFAVYVKSKIYTYLISYYYNCYYCYIICGWNETISIFEYFCFRYFSFQFTSSKWFKLNHLRWYNRAYRLLAAISTIELTLNLSAAEGIVYEYITKSIPMNLWLPKIACWHVNKHTMCRERKWDV